MKMKNQAAAAIADDFDDHSDEFITPRAGPVDLTKWDKGEDAYLHHVTGVQASQRTTWINPTERVQRVRMLGVPGRGFETEWQPGEEKQLPSIFDRAIHVVHQGQVIGGLAPLLVKKGRPRPVAPALLEDSDQWHA